LPRPVVAVVGHVVALNPLQLAGRDDERVAAVEHRAAFGFLWHFGLDLDRRQIGHIVGVVDRLAHRVVCLGHLRFIGHTVTLGLATRGTRLMFDPEHFVAQCDAPVLAGGGTAEVYELLASAVRSGRADPPRAASLTPITTAHSDQLGLAGLVHWPSA